MAEVNLPVWYGMQTHIQLTCMLPCSCSARLYHRNMESSSMHAPCFQLLAWPSQQTHLCGLRLKQIKQCRPWHASSRATYMHASIQLTCVLLCNLHVCLYATYKHASIRLTCILLINLHACSHAVACMAL
jgi:hypothetical protein